MDDSVFVRLVLFYQKRLQFVESANVAVSESALPFSISVMDHLNDLCLFMVHLFRRSSILSSLPWYND